MLAETAWGQPRNAGSRAGAQTFLRTFKICCGGCEEKRAVFSLRLVVFQQHGLNFMFIGGASVCRWQKMSREQLWYNQKSRRRCASRE